MDYETYLDVDAAPRSLFRLPVGGRATRSTRIAMGATRLGISVEEYERHVADGQRWCTGHQRWCSAGDFGSKNSCKAGHAASMRMYKAKKRSEAHADVTP